MVTMKNTKYLLICLGIIVASINVAFATINDVFVIGVAGGSGSGKSTLSDNIGKALGGEAVILRQDAYYKDLSYLPTKAREKMNFDSPAAIDFDLLAQHIGRLRMGKDIMQPTYDFTKNSRTEATKLVKAKKIIIVEGILLLAMEQVRDQLDIKVFIDVPGEERLLRRIKRDMQERGRTLAHIQRQYLTTVAPMYAQHVEPSKEYADVIISHGGKNKVALELLLAKLRHYLPCDKHAAKG